MPRRRRAISLVPADWARSVAHRRMLTGQTTGDLWDILMGKDDPAPPDGGDVLTGDAPPKSLDPGADGASGGGAGWAAGGVLAQRC